MTISIRKEDYESIVAYAREGLPNEACGLLAGVEKEGERIIEKVYYLTNIDASNEHFSMDPKEQLAAIKDMRANGLKPLGNWHSHPETPARPSIEDIRLAYDANATYMILSLMEAVPVLNAFHIEGDGVQREQLKVIA